MNDKYGLKLDVIAKIQGVFTCFKEVDRVVIYGSRAMGNYKNGSDIDIAIFVKPKVAASVLLLTRISEALDDLNLVYSFDLSFYDDISNLDLIEHIKRVGSDLYRELA